MQAASFTRPSTRGLDIGIEAQRMPHRISSAARRTSACSFDDLFKTPTSTKNLELEEDGIGVRLRAQRSTSDALLAASQDLLASSTSSQAHSSSTGNLPSPSSSDSAVESGSAFAHRLSLPVPWASEEAIEEAQHAACQRSSPASASSPLSAEAAAAATVASAFETLESDRAMMRWRATAEAVKAEIANARMAEVKALPRAVSRSWMELEDAHKKAEAAGMAAGLREAEERAQARAAVAVAAAQSEAAMARKDAEAARAAEEVWRVQATEADAAAKAAAVAVDTKAEAQSARMVAAVQLELEKVKAEAAVAKQKSMSLLDTAAKTAASLRAALEAAERRLSEEQVAAVAAKKRAIEATEAAVVTASEAAAKILSVEEAEAAKTAQAIAAARAQEAAAKEKLADRASLAEDRLMMIHHDHSQQLAASAQAAQARAVAMAKNAVRCALEDRALAVISLHRVRAVIRKWVGDVQRRNRLGAALSQSTCHPRAAAIHVWAAWQRKRLNSRYKLDRAVRAIQLRNERIAMAAWLHLVTSRHKQRVMARMALIEWRRGSGGGYRRTWLTWTEMSTTRKRLGAVAQQLRSRTRARAFVTMREGVARLAELIEARRCQYKTVANAALINGAVTVSIRRLKVLMRRWMDFARWHVATPRACRHAARVTQSRHGFLPWTQYVSVQLNRLNIAAKVVAALSNLRVRRAFTTFLAYVTQQNRALATLSFASTAALFRRSRMALFSWKSYASDRFAGIARLLSATARFQGNERLRAILTWHTKAVAEIRISRRIDGTLSALAVLGWPVGRPKRQAFNSWTAFALLRARRQRALMEATRRLMRAIALKGSRRALSFWLLFVRARHNALCVAARAVTSLRCKKQRVALNSWFEHTRLIRRRVQIFTIGGGYLRSAQVRKAWSAWEQAALASFHERQQRVAALDAWRRGGKLRAWGIWAWRAKTAATVDRLLTKGLNGVVANATVRSFETWRWTASALGETLRRIRHSVQSLRMRILTRSLCSWTQAAVSSRGVHCLLSSSLRAWQSRAQHAALRTWAQGTIPVAQTQRTLAYAICWLLKLLHVRAFAWWARVASHQARGMRDSQRASRCMSLRLVRTAVKSWLIWRAERCGESAMARCLADTAGAHCRLFSTLCAFRRWSTAAQALSISRREDSELKSEVTTSVRNVEYDYLGLVAVRSAAESALMGAAAVQSAAFTAAASADIEVSAAWAAVQAAEAQVEQAKAQAADEIMKATQEADAWKAKAHEAETELNRVVCDHLAAIKEPEDEMAAVEAAHYGLLMADELERSRQRAEVKEAEARDGVAKEVQRELAAAREAEMVAQARISELTKERAATADRLLEYEALLAASRHEAAALRVDATRQARELMREPARAIDFLPGSEDEAEVESRWQFSLPLVGKLVLPQVVLPKRLDGDVNRRSPKDINDRATRSSPSSSTMPAALPEPP